MAKFLTEIRGTLVPDRAGRHGPLPPLLIGLTLVTGLVDAFSYLTLGHVFVANMTGNVVFLGFALAGAPGFSITASLAAVAAFGFGALLGGLAGARYSAHRGHLFRLATALQALFLAAAVLLAAFSSSPLTAGFRYPLIVVLAISMGIQNAAARKIAVPDLTLTGIAADSKLAGGSGSKAGRRLTAVAAMLVGALIGAALVRHTQIYFPLLIAFVIVTLAALTAHTLGRTDPAWVHPPT
jgi:uncharacterized membrane protein YoaK (UPF0700 family)